MTGGSRVAWLALELAEVPDDDAWLSEGERGVLGRLTVPKRRRDWRLGRRAAKLALAAELGLPSAALPRLEVRAAASGAPEAYLDGVALPRVVSITHSEGRGVAASSAAPCRLGVDLEVVRPRERAFLEDWFTDAERARMRDDPRGEPLVSTVFWSAKESLLKALREGLRVDPRNLDVDLRAEAAAVTDPERWGALAVAIVPSGERFAGRWRALDAHVLTVVAHPAPDTPTELRLSGGRTERDRP